MSDAERRDALYYGGPSTSICCLNRHRVRVLLRGTYDKPINALALHDTALVGVVPALGRSLAHCFVQVKEVPDVFWSGLIYAFPASPAT